MIEVRVRLVVLEGRAVAVSVDLPLDTSIPTTLDAALLSIPVLQLQGLLQQLRDRMERFQLMQMTHWQLDGLPDSSRIFLSVLQRFCAAAWSALLTELQRPEPSSSKKIAEVVQQSVQLLQSCDALLELAHELLELSGGGLFVGAAQGSELLAKARKIKTWPYYADCAGAQYGRNVMGTMKLILSAMASLAQGRKGMWGTMLGTISNLCSPKSRADSICSALKNPKADFVAQFWSLPEKLPASFGSVNVAVNRCFKIEKVSVRLLRANPDVVPRALLIHAHGGGFVAQSSKSHLNYLTRWCSLLAPEVALLSIDYSLAPRHKFPRALDQIISVHCAVVDDPTLVGGLSPWEWVGFCGDSAGGNLAMAAALHTPHKPDAVVVCYAALCVQSALSSSRLLALCDLMLPFTVLLTCLDAYTGPEGLDGDQLLLGSPLDAADEQLLQLPDEVHLFGAELDPLLDDSVGFCRRLRALGKPVQFEMFDGMPHGCLSLAVACPQFGRAINQVGHTLDKLIKRGLEL